MHKVSSSHNEETSSVLAISDVKLPELQKDTASRVTECDHDQASEIKPFQHRDCWVAMARLLSLDRNISTTTGWMAWKCGTDVTNSDSGFTKSFPLVFLFFQDEDDHQTHKIPLFQSRHHQPPSMQPIISAFMVLSHFRGKRAPVFTSSLADFEALRGKSFMLDSFSKLGATTKMQRKMQHEVNIWHHSFIHQPFLLVFQP